MGYSEQIKSKAGLIGLALLQNMSSIAIGICAELTTSRLRPDARQRRQDSFVVFLFVHEMGHP